MKLLGAILLISGTAVGAGMLALPVLTAESGFIPSTLLFIAIWALTLFTALLIVEVNLSFQGEVNLISMAKNTLGKGAAALTWVLFLLLLYSLSSAYLSAMGLILNEVFESFMGIGIPHALQPMIPLLLFGTFVAAGTRITDRCNRVFVICLVAAYLFLIMAALPKVMYSRFTVQNYPLLFAAVPVAVTSFGFHIVVPSVVSYLGHDVRRIRKAVIFGSLIPLGIYLLWQYVILGVVPLSAITVARSAGAPITEALAELTGAPSIVIFGMAFSFFAIVTSFLGVSLGLFSFLKDGTGKGPKTIMLLAFIPPLLFVEFFPGGFITALQYAGIIVAFISGVLPALMAYQARKTGRSSSYKAPFGSLGIVCAILLSLLIALCDIL